MGLLILPSTKKEAPCAWLFSHFQRNQAAMPPPLTLVTRRTAWMLRGSVKARPQLEPVANCAFCGVILRRSPGGANDVVNLAVSNIHGILQTGDIAFSFDVDRELGAGTDHTVAEDVADVLVVFTSMPITGSIESTMTRKPL